MKRRQHLASKILLSSSFSSSSSSSSDDNNKNNVRNNDCKLQSINENDTITNDTLLNETTTRNDERAEYTQNFTGKSCSEGGDDDDDDNDCNDNDDDNISFFNGDAKSKTDFTSHVAQIRDYFIGYFHLNPPSSRTNVALAMGSNQSFLAHFLALAEIDSVNFVVLMNSRWTTREVTKAMEHCECAAIIVDDHHDELWGDGINSSALVKFKARPFFSVDRGFRQRHDIVLKRSWFVKHENGEGAGMENFWAKVVDSVKPLLAMKDAKDDGGEEKTDKAENGDDEIVEDDLEGLFKLEDVNVIENIEDDEENKKKKKRIENVDIRNNCCLVFTSGTSGNEPKAAILTHSNICAAIDSKLYDKNGPQYDKNDVYLHCAPLYHVGGLVNGLAALAANSKHVFLETFDARSFLHAIVAVEVTAFIVVPTMLRKLERFCSHTDFNSIPRPTSVSSGLENIKPVFETVKKILVGGGAMNKNDVKFAKQLFPNAKIISSYGMTEATSSIAYSFDLSSTLHSSSSKMKVNQGIVIEGIEVKIDNKIDGKNEILIRGETVSKGYYNAAAYLKNRYQNNNNNNDIHTNDENFFRTADAGEIVDGQFLRIIGRLSLGIKTGGENVSCDEVKNVVEEHELVQEAVVFGVPDDKWGEAVVCAVRLQEDAMWANETADVNDPDSWLLLESQLEFKHKEFFLEDEEKINVKKVNVDSLRMWCHQKQMARFKVPKRWIYVEEDFPRNSGGKVDVVELRREILINSRIR